MPSEFYKDGEFILCPDGHNQAMLDNPEFYGVEQLIQELEQTYGPRTTDEFYDSLYNHNRLRVQVVKHGFIRLIDGNVFGTPETLYKHRSQIIKYMKQYDQGHEVVEVVFQDSVDRDSDYAYHTGWKNLQGFLKKYL